MSVVAAAFAAAILFAPGLGLAAAGAENASGDESAPWLVSFEGTWESTSTGPEGETSTTDGESFEQLWCTPESCTYVGPEEEGEIVLTAAQPTGTTSWPASGDPCAESSAWRAPGTATVTFSGSTLVVERDREASGWVDCGGGSRQYTHAQTTLAVAEWTQGELCTLTGDPCPAEAVAAPAPVDPSQDPGAPDRATTSELASGDAAAPSILSALATPATAGTAPTQLALAALLTVILVLLVAFPTSLLNSAVESGSERLSDWWATRRTRPASDVASPPSGAWRRSWWWAAAGVVAASVISAFADPQFGLNAGSARVVLSILVSFAIDVVLGWALVVWIMSRVNPGATHSYSFRPMTLLVVIAAVVFTRLTGFEPGIVFGLVAGVAFAAIAGRAGAAKSALVTLGYAFVLALIAWVLYGVLSGSAGESFLSTLAVETLAAIAVGGMAALPIALFPVRGMPGHAIWQWRRGLWVACYAVGLFAFFIVLMPMPFSWDEVGWELSAWIGVYLLYAVLAVTAWLVLARPWRAEPSSEVTVDPEAAPAPIGADKLDG